MTTNELDNYNWGDYDFFGTEVEVLDTSLRDGLQDSDIRHPNLEEKLELVDKLVKVGIDAIDIAIPVARGPHLRDAIQLARRVPSNVTVACLARTHEVDIKAALELAQGAGRTIEGIIFVGASPLRRFVEGWELNYMRKWMEENVSLAVKEGIIPVVATEHTTETEPDVIKLLYRVGLESGGKKVCIADTTGAATPRGVRKLITFFQEEVLTGFEDVTIDWHGHNDRDLAVANSMEAIDSGARRVHVSVLGIGERAGNTRLESIFTNLKIAGDSRRQELSKIPELSEFGSKIFKVDISSNYPGIGRKAGRTASGIHGSAEWKMRQLRRQGKVSVKNSRSPYSAVDQRWFGREPEVLVGPLAGEDSVLCVLDELGIEASPKMVQKILDSAVTQQEVFSKEKVRNIARSLEGNGHNGNS